MTYQLRLPLLAVVLFCLTSMAGCPNKEPAGQFTVVQGHVTNIRTGRPLPGVLVVLASDNRGTSSYNQVEDSVRTDARGSYALSFTNKATLYYAVSCEGTAPYPFYPLYRLDFADSTYHQPPFTGTVTTSLRTAELVVGKTNLVKFKASPRRVFRVRVTTRTTGYSQLLIPNLTSRSANNQQFTVLIYQVPLFFAGTSQQFAQQPGILPGVYFTRQATNGTRQDTLVRVVPTTPITADTVEANLQFGH